jgi:hypothetical protein
MGCVDGVEEGRDVWMELRRVMTWVEMKVALRGDCWAVLTAESLVGMLAEWWGGQTAVKKGETKAAWKDEKLDSKWVARKAAWKVGWKGGLWVDW